MTWLLGGAAFAGWMCVAVLVFLSGQFQRRSMQAALRLRASVEPYLRRRAAEIDEVPPRPTDPSSSPDQILRSLCDLADRLMEHERRQVALGDTLNVAVSDTMPVDSARDSGPRPT
jgi:hypothetical protein